MNMDVSRYVKQDGLGMLYIQPHNHKYIKHLASPRILAVNFLKSKICCLTNNTPVSLPPNKLKDVGSICALKHRGSVLHQNTNAHEYVECVPSIQWGLHDAVHPTWNSNAINVSTSSTVDLKYDLARIYVANYSHGSIIFRNMANQQEDWEQTRRFWKKVPKSYP